MPVQFTCPKCGQKLTLTVSRPGDWIDCPGCEASVQIPGEAAPPKPKPTPEPRPKAKPRPARAAAPPDDFDDRPTSPWADKRVQAGAIAGGVVLLLLFATAGLVLALRPAKKEPEVVRNETPAARPVAAPIPAPATQPAAQPTPPPRPPAPTEPSPAPKEPKPKVAPAPEPEPPEPPAPAAPPIDYSKLDQFGNPIDQNAGLAKQNEFGGQRILFWSAHSGAGDVFFSAKNPLWKALEQKGFTVRRQFGRFDSAWLKETDQLWVLSTAPSELLAAQRANVPDLALLRKTLKDFAGMGIDAKEIGAGFPKEWTADDIIDMTIADIGMLLSPSSHLTAKDYDAIVAFAKSGKGLCLLADNDPATTEAGELARRLFGVGVAGNYQATKVAYVKQRKLTPDEVKKHKGDYGVDDHPLLTGVNFVYEGITISTVTGGGWAEKLDVALRASDGKPVVMVSKVPGLRVVLDCGFTRYYHGPSDRVSFINMTAGTTRLAQNIAAHLAGKDAPKKK